MTLSESVEVLESRWVRARRSIFTLSIFLLVLSLFPFVEDPAEEIKYLVCGLSAVALGALALWSAGNDPPLRLQAPPFILMGAWMMVLIVSAALSPFAVQSLYSLHRPALFLLLCAYAAITFRSTLSVERLFLAIVLAVSLSSVYGLCQRIGWDPFPWVTRDIEEYRALPATFGNPNFAGHALVVAILLALGLAARPGRRWCALPALLMGMHLYFTQMRGGPVALAAAAGGVAVAWGVSGGFKHWRPNLLLLVSIVAVVVAGFGWAGVQKARGREILPMDTSLALRYAAAYGATSMILDHPLLGAGPGNYVLAAPPYWTSFEQRWYAERGQKMQHVHNELLETTVEGGILAALLYLMLFAWGTLATLRIAVGAVSPDKRRIGVTLFAVFIALFVDGIFGFNLHVPVSGAFFFILLGVVHALSEGHGGVRAHRPLFFLLLLLASLCLAQESRRFIAEMAFQRAQAALAFAQRSDVSPDYRGRILQESHRQLNFAHGLLPWEPRYLRALGGVSQEQQHFELALRGYEEALRLQPFDPGLLLQTAQAHVNRAAALAEGRKGSTEAISEETSAALALASQILALNPHFGLAHEVRGRVALLEGSAGEAGADMAKWQEAQEELEAALVAGVPAPVDTMLLRAQALLNLGAYEVEVAAHVLDQAGRQAPDHPQLMPLWDRLLKKEPHLGDAYVEALNECLDLLLRSEANPSALAEIQYRLGKFYLDSLHQSALASLFFARALESAPARLDIWGGYVRSQPILTALDALKEQVQRVGSRTGGKEVPAELMALAATAPPTSDAILQWARQLATRARKLTTESSPEQAALQVGWQAELILQLLGKETLENEAKGQILTNVASVFVDAARYVEADELLSRTMTLLQGQAQAVPLLLRSRTQAALGQAPLARDLAREAVRLAPSNTEARHHLARLLVQQGAKAEANLEYLALLSQLPPESPLYAQAQEELKAMQESHAEGAAP